MKVKNSWEELTLNEVLQIQQIISADIDETYKASNLLSILSGLDVDEIESMPIQQFMKLTPNLEFLKNIPKKRPHTDFYIVGGKKYKLCANIHSITTAQYIDYQQYMKEENPDLVKLTSIFLIPDGHNYNDGYDMEVVWGDIGEMKFVDIDSIAFFLRKQFALYTMITADYLNQAMKKEKIKKKDRNEALLPLHNMALSLLS
jgi:hypothetical protein